MSLECWFFLISSDLISSQLPLEIAHCIPLSPQFVSSHLISSSQLISTHPIFLIFLNSSHLIPPHVFSQLFSADHNCSHRFSCHNFLHAEDFAHRSFSHIATANFFTQQAFTQRFFYTQNFLHTANFYTQPVFTQKISCTQKFLHREALTQRSMYTEELLDTEASTPRSFYTANFHTPKILHTASFYTEKFLHRVGEMFIHSKFLHTEAFTHSQLLHRGTFSQRSNSKKLLHGRFCTQQAFKLKTIADKSLSQA